MTTKSKSALTEATILNAAAARRNGAILPLPDNRDPASPKAAKILTRMLANGLLEERSTTKQQEAWRPGDGGKHFTLRITSAGRAAISKTGTPAAESDLEPPQPSSPAAAAEPQLRSAQPPRGKLGQVAAAVQQPGGISIGDLAALTGWQAHTIRASLTRLRQSGLSITLEANEGGKRYVVNPVESTVAAPAGHGTCD
jgi:hypothetical protein